MGEQQELKESPMEKSHKLYNWVLKCLVIQNGGELFVRLDDVESGYLIFKHENHGIRFKFLSQG